MRYAASSVACTLLLLAPAWCSSCKVSGPERDVYRALLTGTNAPAIVESQPEQTPSSLFDLTPRQLQDAVSGLTPRLEAAPKNSVTIFASPSADFVFIPPSIRQQILHDYVVKAARKCTIPKLDVPSVRVLSMAQVQSLTKPTDHNDPEAYWRRFHQRFGSNASLYSLSRVAFDKQMTVAVVHVSSALSHDGAGGMLYVLRRSDNGWSVFRSYITWAT